jgi:hypothetical protein
MVTNALWTLGDGAPSLDPSCSEDTGKSSLRSTRSGAAPKKGLGGGSENQLATRLQVGDVCGADMVGSYAVAVGSLAHCATR